MSEERKLPNELLTKETVYTLGGATTGVWVVCIVISQLAPADTLVGWPMRLIAFCLSFLLMSMLLAKLERKERTLERWVLAVVNACLIFLNTSGLTSMTKNVFADPVPEAAVPADGGTLHAGFSLQGLFRDQVEWWPNEQLLYANTVLGAENAVLKETIAVLRQSPQAPDTAAPAPALPGDTVHITDEAAVLRARACAQQAGVMKRTLLATQDSLADYREAYLECLAKARTGDGTDCGEQLETMRERLGACTYENAELERRLKQEIMRRADPSKR